LGIFKKFKVWCKWKRDNLRLLKMRMMKFLLAIATSACLPSCNLSKQHEQHEAAKLLPDNIQVIRDFSYGENTRQRMDIYKPNDAKNAPVILMLYGGGYYGDDKSKSERLIYINKVTRWGPKGFIVISVATRNLPEFDAYVQVEDLALAIAKAQKNAIKWGGNPDKFFIMGHSSGGHLISLLCAKPSLVTDVGGRPWLAGVSLDSSSMDIPQAMRMWHPIFFDAAFGKNPNRWISASPFHQLSKNSIPLFIACSTQREDKPCENAEAFAKQAINLGVNVKVNPLNLNHGEINDQLGLESAYTIEVEKFMASLDKDVAQRLNMD
jgi:arylformamidase